MTERRSGASVLLNEKLALANRRPQRNGDSLQGGNAASPINSKKDSASAIITRRQRQEDRSIVEEKHAIANRRWKSHEREENNKSCPPCLEQNSNSNTAAAASVKRSRRSSPGLQVTSFIEQLANHDTGSSNFLMQKTKKKSLSKRKQEQTTKTFSTTSLVEAIPVAQVAQNNNNKEHTKKRDIESNINENSPADVVQRAQAVDVKTLPWWKRQNPYCLLATVVGLAVLLGVSIYLGITFGGGNNNATTAIIDDDDMVLLGNNTGNDTSILMMDQFNSTMTPSPTVVEQLPFVLDDPIFASFQIEEEREPNNNTLQDDEEDTSIEARFISFIIEAFPPSRSAFTTSNETMNQDSIFPPTSTTMTSPQLRAIRHLMWLHNIIQFEDRLVSNTSTTVVSEIPIPPPPPLQPMTNDTDPPVNLPLPLARQALPEEPSLNDNNNTKPIPLSIPPPLRPPPVPEVIQRPNDNDTDPIPLTLPPPPPPPPVLPPPLRPPPPEVTQLPNNGTNPIPLVLPPPLRPPPPLNFMQELNNDTNPIPLTIPPPLRPPPVPDVIQRPNNSTDPIPLVLPPPPRPPPVLPPPLRPPPPLLPPPLRPPPVPDVIQRPNNGTDPIPLVLPPPPRPPPPSLPQQILPNVSTPIPISLAVFEQVPFIVHNASDILDSLDPDMLIQQFALLTLFYSTGGGESRWFNSTGWRVLVDVDTNECNWFGIVCSNNNINGENSTNPLKEDVPGRTNTTIPTMTRNIVTEIVLPSNNLMGTIPQEVLGILTELMHLDLSENQLMGSLSFELPLFQDGTTSSGNITDLEPAVLSLRHLNVSSNLQLEGNITSIFSLIKNDNMGNQGLLSGLTHLDLAQTLVTGSIFDALSPTENDIEPYNLQHLRLGQNPRLERSSLPSTDLGQWSQLTHLQVNGLLLGGELPTQISQLQNLKVLDLTNNLFVGGLPSELGELNGTLQQLELRLNLLSGPLPMEMAHLTQLETLDLSDNFGLRGTLDTLKLENYTKLQSLDVSFTSLSGTLPLGLFELSSLLVHASFGNSRFSGSLPTHLGQLELLEVLDLEGNDFTGTFPTEMFQLPKLRVLDCSRNRFNGTFPEEFGDLFETLNTLDLRLNDFSGLFPIQIGEGRREDYFENVSSFDISENEIGGFLPIGLCGKVDCNFILCRCCGCAFRPAPPPPPAEPSVVFFNPICLSPDERAQHLARFRESDPPGPLLTGNVTEAPSPAPSFGPPPPNTCEFGLTFSCSGAAECSSVLLDLPETTRCTDIPTHIMFRYNGGDCNQSTTSQPSPLFTCRDSSSSEPAMQNVGSLVNGAAFIVVADVVSGAIYHANYVNVSSFFSLDMIGRLETVGSRMNVTIYSSSTRLAENMIQTMEFASSCRRPIDAGDKFGAVQILSFANDAQGSVSLLRDVSFISRILNQGQCPLRSFNLTRQVSTISTEGNVVTYPPDMIIRRGRSLFPMSASTFQTHVRFDLSIPKSFTLSALVDAASNVLECSKSGNLTIFGGTPVSIR